MCATPTGRNAGTGRKAPSPANESKADERNRIASREALYAHALAIEREAVATYRDLALRMEDLGEDTLAELFNRLQLFEQTHLHVLTAKTAKMTLPAIAPGEYAWMQSGAPVPEARELVFRMMTPRVALQLALAAEERAKAFFESVQQASRDAEITALAHEFAEEEQIHIDTVRFALDGLPQRYDPAGAEN